MPNFTGGQPEPESERVQVEHDKQQEGTQQNDNAGGDAANTTRRQERTFNVPVRFGGDHMIITTYTTTDTIATLKTKVAESIKVKLGDKTFDETAFTLYYLNKSLEFESWRRVCEFNIKKHHYISAKLRLIGGAGAKRQRADEVISVGFESSPEDPPSVQMVSQMKTFNMNVWLEELDTATLQKMLAVYESISSSHANVDWHVTHLCDFVPVFNDLKEPIEKPS